MDNARIEMVKKCQTELEAFIEKSGEVDVIMSVMMGVNLRHLMAKGATLEQVVTQITAAWKIIETSAQKPSQVSSAPDPTSNTEGKK